MMAETSANLQNEPTTARCEQRLLDAAAEVFAEVGFRDATVREICRRAGANVASVNYHFGDKARLYSETLRYLANSALSKYPPDFGVPTTAPAEDRLRGFVESFLLKIFSDDRVGLYGRMITREMAEPTHALHERVEETVRPMANLVAGIVRQVLGEGASDADVRRGAFSVIGQIVFYKHCQPIIDALFPGHPIGAAEIRSLTDHITTFSLAGLNAMAARAKQK
jgi:AcrR family transcriptional regulator